MEQHDGEKTLHYVDPPYLPETRDAGGDYCHEMTAADHEELAAFLCQLQGMVIVSGYHSSLYDRLFAGWERVEKAALADGARKRTEVLGCEMCKAIGSIFKGINARLIRRGKEERMGTTEQVPDESSRLLSCPWCGSNEIEEAEMPHDQVAMICEQCGAGGPVCAYNDQAEEAWNSIKLPGMDDYYLVVNERDELLRCVSELGGPKYFEEWKKQEKGQAR